MSGDFPDRIAELRRRAARQPEGPLQIETLEEAVRLADLHQDLDLAFETRIELVEAACWGGAPDRMLVAYSWCLAQFDRHPDRFEVHRLYWMYKWILNELPLWPRVSREQIEAAFQDAERRYRERGISLRPLHQIRMMALCDLGRPEESEEPYRKWKESLRDWYTDCAACEPSCRVDVLVDQGRDEEALQAAAPLLSGRLRCKEEPGRTYARVLLPLLRQGRGAEAVPLFLKAARFAGRNAKFVWAAGRFLDFLALTGNLTRAVRLLESRLRIALEAPVPANRFDFLLGLRTFLTVLRETRSKPLRLRLPETFPGHRADSTYPLGDLLAWCEAELSALARAFDARNGNDAYSRRIVLHGDLRKFAVDLPIAGRS